MKPLALVIAGAALLFSGCVGSGTAYRSDEAPPTSYAASEEPFPVLNAYGTWIDAGAYGRVWQPAVLSDWRPYTLGSWVWTDRGWMWDSDEPFGWVVYHYGYWTQIGGLGWVWVPGNEWAPARVDWYCDNGYVGWAPMCPPQASYPEAYQPGYENYWTVVPAPQFTRLNVGAYRVVTPQPATRTTGGSRGKPAATRPPDIITIQGATHQLISPVKTEEENVRTGRRTVERVRIAEQNRTQPAPVYSAPARPDPVTQPPSAPVYLPGASRSLPTPAPTAPAPRSPAVVTPAPAPAPSPGRTVTTLPAPVRVTPVPAPVHVAPAPARTDTKRVVTPEKKPVQNSDKKDSK